MAAKNLSKSQSAAQQKQVNRATILISRIEGSLKKVDEYHGALEDYLALIKKVMEHIREDMEELYKATFLDSPGEDWDVPVIINHQTTVAHKKTVPRKRHRSEA